MLNRRTVLVTGVGLAAGAAVAGCSSANASSAKWQAAGTTPSGSTGSGSPTGSPSPTAHVTVTPAADTKEVSPADAVTVAIESGTLQSVTVTAGSKTLAGKLAGDGKSWKSTGTMSYGQTYTVTITGADDKGVAVNQTTTFDTVKAAAVVSATFQANPMLAMTQNATYGVGQPVIVHFSKSVKDKAAAEKAIDVDTSPPVEGRWHWISDQSAHWRPEKYWTSGTKVTVKANLLGVNLGNNYYGGGNNSVSFSIGQSRVAIADSNTHQMQVFVDGNLVKTMPISMGKGGETKGSKGETVDFWTRSGVHVLMTKEPQTTMSSATYGINDPKNPNYYSETIKLACRITLSGEYVHLADWNIPDQGKRNTSHGCINVGPTNAQWFYDNFQPGDIVEVRNTPKQMAIDDGVGDWDIPWNQWQ
jgi:lipoprotein-anchoring transpeptidase ErfK/SrfK